MADVRPADLEVHVPRQQFSLGVMASSLGLVLRAGTRLRCVGKELALNFGWWDIEASPASYHSTRLWLLRLGLFQLNRPKQRADDWMWIVDHTLQMGDRKGLIIVGVRQSAWDAEDRVLSHEDVDLIDLQPVTKSNGNVVYRQLKAATATTGVPRAIVSDNGGDLHSGIAVPQGSSRHSVGV